MTFSLRNIVLCSAVVCTYSFQTHTVPFPHLSRLQQAGRGWDNSNFLDSLGGSDDDIQQANENYQTFSKTRQAFLDRQQEYAKTESGKRALEHQKKFLEQRVEDPSLDESDQALDDPASRSGGSRFAAMMDQAQKRNQGFDDDNFIAGGFEQKLAIPLDEELPENNEEDDTGLLF